MPNALPDDLRAALNEELAGVSSKQLAGAARSISQRYRTASPSKADLTSQLEILAYAGYRMPATFAASSAALIEIRDRLPQFEPLTVNDVGGGPGTAARAALEIWPSLNNVTVLDRNSGMIQLGKSLAKVSGSAVMRNAVWIAADATAGPEFNPADLTIAAYLLGELPVDSRSEFLKCLWQQTRDTCLILDAGTPRSYSAIREAGLLLASLGAHIVAPFPLDWPCLESERDWSHFPARLPRSSMMRALKDAELSYEDEKYSYVAASRAPGMPIAARVVRHPQARSGHIRLKLCTARGLKDLVVTRANPPAFRLAKDLRWGSAIEASDADLLGVPVD